MPTQEERLSALEQTVAALNRGIWDINHNETILLGMATKQDENIRGIITSLVALNERFNTFEQSVTNRFEVLEHRFGVLEHRFGTLEHRFGTLEQSMNSRFEAQDKKFDQILLLLNTLTPKPGQET